MKNTNKLKEKISSSSQQEEEFEIQKYINLYQDNNFSEHYEVNNFITRKKMWNEFTHIRSLNDHGRNKQIPGILPKFYSIVCKRLSINGANGASLDKAEHY